MKIDFYTLPKGHGIQCEHCGTYIVNVYQITFNDGFILRCGSECFKKLQKQTNLNDYGIKTLNKLLKKLQGYEKMIKQWENWNTPEEAEEDKCYQRIEDKKAGCWRIRTQEEFEKEKEILLTFYIPSWIKQTQKEIKDKFKNVKLKK
jgi:hypothetical protein